MSRFGPIVRSNACLVSRDAESAECSLDGKLSIQTRLSDTVVKFDEISPIFLDASLRNCENQIESHLYR